MLGIFVFAAVALAASGSKVQYSFVDPQGIGGEAASTLHPHGLEGGRFAR